jgi:HK97 family phage portal protein
MGLHFNFREGLSWQRSEAHNIDKVALWNTGADIGEPVDAGVLMSQEAALRLSVVYRCIQLISGTLAGLPIDIVRKRGTLREPVDRVPAWVDTPNPESTSFEFVERVVESLLMDGNAFILISARDSMGFPAELWTLSPRQIEVRRRNSRVEFVWNGDQNLSRFGPNNPTGDVLHIKLNSAGGIRGMSPLDLARQSLGLTRAAEKFGAKFFGNGQQMSGVIQLPATSAPVSRENIGLIRENWMSEHSGTDKAHRPGVLTGGATWQPTSVTPENAQFLETRKFQVEDIARWYGVPAHMVGLEEKNTSWGTGIEAQSTGFVRFVLKPHIDRLEDAFSQLTPRGEFVKLNLASLLRADTATETEVLVKQALNGLRSRNEAREKLDLPPIPGGDRFLLPLNEQVLTGAGKPEPMPAPATPPVTAVGE